MTVISDFKLDISEGAGRDVFREFWERPGHGARGARRGAGRDIHGRYGRQDG